MEPASRLRLAKVTLHSGTGMTFLFWQGSQWERIRPSLFRGLVALLGRSPLRLLFSSSRAIQRYEQSRTRSAEGTNGGDPSKKSLLLKSDICRRDVRPLSRELAGVCP